MCRRTAAAKRPIPPVAMVLRASVVAFLLLTSPHLGAAVWEHGEAPVVSPVVRSGVRRDNSFRWIVTDHLPGTPLDGVSALGGKTSVPPGTAGGNNSPSLSNRDSTPLTEGLREDRPTQVRVDVRRWRMVIPASGGKASRCGRMPNRRSTCTAPWLAFPSLSLQEMFCTWVI